MGAGMLRLACRGTLERAAMSKSSCLVLLLLGALAAPALGQDQAFEQRRRQIEEQVRLELDQAVPGDQRALLEAGGWFRVAAELFDDVNRRDRTLRTGDLRLWMRLKIDRAHEIYVRLRTGWTDWAGNDSFDGNDDDFTDPRLDRFWVRLALGNPRQAGGVAADLTFGRQYVELGTGVAISLPLDAVLATIRTDSWEFSGLVGWLIASTNNIDTSVPGYEHSRRLFVGGQVRYLGLAGHEPFAYIAWQHDHSGESPVDPTQDYLYNSTYVGLGSTGRLFVPDFKYGFEWVYEFGRSYGWGGRWPDDISASAMDVQLEYTFRDAPARPKVGFEFLWATGDPDRIGSPTNALGGNRPGTTDGGFSGFGYRDTGFEFAPRMSNLKMWRFGAACYPFDKTGVQWLRDFEVGFNWYLYRKHSAPAAVSDYTAYNINADLGHEADIYFTWRVTSDLALDFRLGTFLPGDAFGDQGTRRYMYWGVRYTF
jgi:hypothetical protein